MKNYWPCWAQQKVSRQIEWRGKLSLRYYATVENMWTITCWIANSNYPIWIPTAADKHFSAWRTAYSAYALRGRAGEHTITTAGVSSLHQSQRVERENNQRGDTNVVLCTYHASYGERHQAASVGASIWATLGNCWETVSWLFKKCIRNWTFFKELGRVKM